MVNPVNIHKNLTGISFGQNKASVQTSSSDNDRQSTIIDSVTSASASVPGKSVVKKLFVPAETKEELKAQISKIDWMPERNKQYKSYDINGIKDSDVPVISRFFYDAEKLNPQLKSGLNVSFVLSFCCSGMTDNLKDFSPDNFNSLNPELQKDISKNISFNVFHPVLNSKAVNTLYETLDEKYRNVFSTSFKLLGGNTQTLTERINTAKIVNGADTRFTKKIKLEKLFEEPDNKYISGVFAALDTLPETTKNKLDSYYLNKLFEENYSYAVAYNDKKPVCGTSDFKPFETKEQLVQELATMRDNDGTWMFSNEDIAEITGNDNDLGELSKILDEFASKKYKFSPHTLKNILMREGITYDIVKPNSVFYAEILNNDEYKSLKSVVQEAPVKFFALEPDKLSSLRQNIDTANVLYDFNPDNFTKFPGQALSSVSNAKIPTQMLSEILNGGFYSETPDILQLDSLITFKDGKEVKNENIEFLKDLKNTPELNFLFDMSFNSLNEYSISDLLTRELPENFSLENKTETIKFLSKIHQNPETERLMGTCGIADNYVDILLKDNEDDTEYAEKIADFAVENKLADCDSYKYLTKHSYKDTYDLMIKFQNNGLLKGKYSLIHDYDVKLLENFCEVCEHAVNTEAFSDVQITGYDLNFYNNEKDKAIAGSLNIDTDMNVRRINSNLNLLNEVSKTVKPELWQDVKNEVFSNVLCNLSDKPYTLKFNNIAYLNEVYSDERFKTTFGHLNEASKLLTDNIDTDTLINNKDKMFDFIDSHGNNQNLYIDKESFLSFEGDYVLLNSEVARLSQKYPDEDIEIIADKDKITIKAGEFTEFVYDRNMNLIHKNISFSSKRDNGTQINGLISDESDKNIKTYRVQAYDPVYEYPKTEKCVNIYCDNNGRHIKTKKYEASEVPGFVDIKEVMPSGEIKVLSETKRLGSGIISEKHLTSPSGCTTDSRSEINKNGDEFFENIIKDSSGNVLSVVRRSTENIDAENKMTEVNGRKYFIHYGNDDIEVKDEADGKTYNISISQINPGKNATIYNLLKELPGDELIIMQSFVNKIELTRKIDSCINPVDKTMYVGPHSFIFEHEFGHGKDELSGISIESPNNFDITSRIASDDKLREIFETEKKTLFDSAPSSITEEVMYFVADGDSHYGGEKGGLKETIAEANAIQSGKSFHPLLKMRTQILQEYFPRTLAYLNNTYLLPQ